MKKKILAILLAAVMAVSLLPGTAWAAEEENSGTCGDNLTWSYSDGVLTIGGTGPMVSYLDAGSTTIKARPWYDYRDQIQTVTIGDGVTSIGNGAFALCGSLTEVDIPNSVTSIGEFAFYGTGLTDVTLPDGLTSIGRAAFYGCEGLTEAVIPDSVTEIGGLAFAYAGLTSVTIPDSITEIGEAVFAYTGLTDVTIPDSVTVIGDSAFAGTGLTSVTIPSSVTSIGTWAFQDCTSLTEVTIPEGVTSIGDEAFESCASLTRVTIPASVTSIGTNVFFDSTSLTAIEVAEGNAAYSSVDGVLFDKGQTTLITYPAGKNGASYDIPASVTKIGDYAFYESGLTGVTVPAGVTEIGVGAFSACSGLTAIEVAEGNTAYTSVDGVLFDKGQTKLITYPAGKSGTSYSVPDSVTAISDEAFNGNKSLTAVTVPDGVTSIGTWAFQDCTSLTEVTIPAGVTYIEEGTFYGCESLTDIHYGGTQAQWNDVYIDNYNDVLLVSGVTIHFAVTDFEPEQPTEPENPFTDVPAGEWYADSVLWAVEKGITTGTDDGTTFEPDRDCHDIEILTMLYRADSGESQGNGGDMARAVAWALENGLISEDYDVTAECTRATAVWYIWKVLGADDTAPAYSFTDVKADANYAAAVNWAVATGVTNGSEDGTTFSPGDPCSRGMIATFLYRAYANSVSE